MLSVENTSPGVCVSTSASICVMFCQTFRYLRERERARERACETDRQTDGASERERERDISRLIGSRHLSVCTHSSGFQDIDYFAKRVQCTESLRVCVCVCVCVLERQIHIICTH
jgi:hypothetical protein